jgi:hypothetical protein
MGAGKSSVLGEASDILSIRHLPHAAIDLDGLALGYLPDGSGKDEFMYRNLHSVCANFAAAGVSRFIVARALEKRAELEHCREAVSAEDVVVCRLNADVALMQQRVARRETGVFQETFVARVAKLNEILDRANLEDFTIANGDRALKEIATEMLDKAGWL